MSKQKITIKFALFLSFTLTVTTSIAQSGTPIQETNYWTMFTHGDGLCRDTATNELIDGLVYGISDLGDTLVKFNLKDGVRHGTQLTWHKNGQLESEYHYQMGIEQGVRKIWHPNGSAHHVEHFKNGKPHGSFKSWYMDGQLALEHYYSEGEQDGLQRSWGENGKLKYENNYLKGELHGFQKEWYENGQPKYVAETVQGEYIKEMCWDEQGKTENCN